MIELGHQISSPRRLLKFVTDLRGKAPRVTCQQLGSCEEGVYRLICLTGAIHPPSSDAIRVVCHRCRVIRPESELRSGRKGLICCPGRGKPRIDRIINFQIFVFDHTTMEVMVPLTVSGAEAVRLLGCSVAEVVADPARLADWYGRHLHGPGDFGVRVLAPRGRSSREYSVVNTVSTTAPGFAWDQ